MSSKCKYCKEKSKEEIVRELDMAIEELSKRGSATMDCNLDKRIELIDKINIMRRYCLSDHAIENHKKSNMLEVQNSEIGIESDKNE